MKTYVWVEVQLHAFLTTARDGGEWSASRPELFTAVEKAPILWLGGPLSRSGRADENIPAPTGNRTPVVQTYLLS
jgi:hypothetical protein